MPSLDLDRSRITCKGASAHMCAYQRERTRERASKRERGRGREREREREKLPVRDVEVLPAFGCVETDRRGHYGVLKFARFDCPRQHRAARRQAWKQGTHMIAGGGAW